MMVTKAMLKEAGKGLGKVPLSLHVEYFGGKPFEVDKLAPVMAAHERDLGVLRGWM